MDPQTQLDFLNLADALALGSVRLLGVTSDGYLIFETPYGTSEL